MLLHIKCCGFYWDYPVTDLLPSLKQILEYKGWLDTKMNILQIAVKDQHTEMILFLVKEDPTLLHYTLSDGTTVLENLKKHYINIEPITIK